MSKDFYLHKRGNIWYVQFVLPDGRRTTARSSGQTNKTAAEKWAKTELPKIGSPKITLGAWAGQFFQDDCPHISRLKEENKPYSDPHKANQYSLLKNHILPDPICSILLGDLTKNDILLFRQRLVKAVGLSSVSQKTMGALRVIIREALFREFIQRDLFAGIGKIQYDEVKREALTQDALKKVLDPGSFANRIHYEATFCAAVTGLRAGEVRGLKWSSLVGDVLIVDRKIYTQSDKSAKPKWGKVRAGPYPKILQDMLEPRRGKPDDWVFSISGGPMGYREWRRAMKTLDLAGVTLHSLRHTLNTMLRGEGVNDAILQGAFGWSGPEMQENYTDKTKYDYSEMGADIDRLIGGIIESH